MTQENKPQDQKPVENKQTTPVAETKPAATVATQEHKPAQAPVKSPEQLAAEQKVKDDAAAAEKAEADRVAQAEKAKLDAEEAPLEDGVVLPSELDLLKQRATLLNISFHPNIGLDKLKEKVNLALRMPAQASEHTIEAGVTNVNELPSDATFTEYSSAELESGYIDPKETKLSPAELRNEAIQNARKLVRIRVTNMNPNKRDWPGEVLTVSNRVVGTHKKFVPFNSPEPYHVPNIILQMMKERMCQIFVNAKGENGETIKRAQAMKEFNIEVLPPLSMEEIRALAQRQAMANGTQA